MGDERAPETDRGKGWSVIPPDVVQAKLPWAAKVLYGRIAWLDNSDRGCWASNAWLGRDVGLGERTVSRHVSTLVEAGFVESETVYTTDPSTGKPKPERRLRAASPVDARSGVHARSGEHADARSGEGGSPEVASTENGRKPAADQGRTPDPVHASSGYQPVERPGEGTMGGSAVPEGTPGAGDHPREDGDRAAAGSRGCPSCGRPTKMPEGRCPRCRGLASQPSAEPEEAQEDPRKFLDRPPDPEDVVQVGEDHPTSPRPAEASGERLTGDAILEAATEELDLAEVRR